MTITKDSKIYVAGHHGMVGSAVCRALEQAGYRNYIGRPSRALDLRDQAAVEAFFAAEQPRYVIAAAARVGGIMANKEHPYLFLMENLQIQNNLIEAAHRHGVEKFIFLGSSCIYPKLAPQPLREEYLLSGPLEPTNEWYALAKIAGAKACEAIHRQFGKAFFSLMPTNLYGPNDNYDLESSHVLPAMIRKFHDAKVAGHAPVTLWGSGSPLREFLHVDDLASAIRFALEHELPADLYNVGTGDDLPIKELAHLIQDIIGHHGEIHWDRSKPDGTPRKLLDVSKLAEAGWQASIGLADGIRQTYEWFLTHQDTFKELKFSDD
jgi:GDP-L-fucose synthase